MSEEREPVWVLSEINGTTEDQYVYVLLEANALLKESLDEFERIHPEVDELSHTTLRKILGLQTKKGEKAYRDSAHWSDAPEVLAAREQLRITTIRSKELLVAEQKRISGHKKANLYTRIRRWLGW